MAALTIQIPQYRSGPYFKLCKGDDVLPSESLWLVAAVPIAITMQITVTTADC